MYDRTAVGATGAYVNVNEQGEIVGVDLDGFTTTVSEQGGSRITDAGLVHLAGLTSLEVLHLDDTQITDAGVAKLKEVLPDCEIKR